MVTGKIAVRLSGSLLLALAFSACSSGPSAPRMGTPEWYWSAAREQFAIAAYTKTQEHLGKIVDSNSPLQARAATWRLVVLAGMARGHRDVARAYLDGSEAAKTQSAEFHVVVNDMRRYSRQYSISLAEEVMRLQKDMGNEEKYTLDFPFPIGSPLEVPALATIRKGFLPPEADRLSADRQPSREASCWKRPRWSAPGRTRPKRRRCSKPRPSRRRATSSC